MVRFGLYGKKLLAISALLLLSGTLPVLVGPSEGVAKHSHCSDGKDNDNDGRLDYPEDDDCEDLDDDYEGVSTSGLFVTLTDGRETVRSGDAVIYVITLRQEREATRLVDLDLHLPFQANGVNASEGGSYVGGDRIHWDNIGVQKGVSKKLTVSMNITGGAPAGKLLIARVLAEGAEATDTTMVDNPTIPYEKPLRLSVTDGKEFVRPGEETTYTITLKNISTRELTDELRFSLPKASSFVKATQGYQQITDKVQWFDVRLSPNETKTFTVTVRTDNRVTDNLSIRGRATYGSYSETDDTVITRGVEPGSIKVSINDNRDQARIGDLITYNVSVHNTSSVLAPAVNIDSSFPVWNEFVSATEGGYWDGKNVRWLNIPVAANGVRNLQYVIRVRSDAPMGSDLLATVRGDGQNGKSSDDDYTTVVKRITSDPYVAVQTATTDSTTTTSVTPADVVYTPGENGVKRANVLFNKYADRSEATAGGTVRYTIVVRNTLDHVIDDAVITDKFKTEHFTHVDGKPLTSGSLQWNVPALRPGATWKMSYTLTVSPDMLHGWVVSNIATIEGADLADVPLSERIRVVQTGIVSSLPQTGAPMDALFLLVTSGLSFGMAAAGRRKLI